jgi:MFS family permease
VLVWDQMTWIVSAPVLQGSLRVSDLGLGAAMIGYGLAATAPQPLAHRAADRFGNRQVLLLGLLLLAGACAAAAFVRNGTELVLARSAIGAGAALVLVAGWRLRAAGRSAGASGGRGGVLVAAGIAAGTGLVGTGLLIERVGWRAVPAATALLVLLSILLLAGASAESSAAGAARAGVEPAPRAVDSGRRAIVAGLAAAVGSAPLVPLMQFLQIDLGYSPLTAGLRTLPMVVAAGVASAAVGGLARTRVVRGVGPAGFLLAAVGMGLLSRIELPVYDVFSVLDVAAGYRQALMGTVLFGAGFGLVLGRLALPVRLAVDPSRPTARNPGIGLTVTLPVGGALGGAAATLVMARTFHPLASLAEDGRTPELAGLEDGVVAGIRILWPMGDIGSVLLLAVHHYFIDALRHVALFTAGIAVLGMLFALFLPVPSSRLPSPSPEDGGPQDSR